MPMKLIQVKAKNRPMSFVTRNESSWSSSTTFQYQNSLHLLLPARSDKYRRCSIDFHGSTFPCTVKELLISTPCYSLTTLGSPTMTRASSTCWSHQNFLAAYPEEKKEVIAVPRVRWPKIKKLFLVFETSVADFISYIDMPDMEQVTLVDLEWRLIEGRSDSGESNNESSDEDDSSGDDGAASNSSRAVTSRTKDCYFHGA
jgi:hypothetical protein